MADDRRTRRDAPAGPNAIIASADLLTSRRIVDRLPDVEGWQSEAWDFFDTIGEVRFATSWFANALSRCRLVAAWRGEAGDEPATIRPVAPADGDDEGESSPPPAGVDDEGLTPIERAAFDAMQTLGGGTAGQGRILSDFGVQLAVPGVGYLVGEPLGRLDPADTTPAAETWQVVSADEVKAVPPTNAADPDARTTYRIKVGEGDRDDAWRDLHPDALVVRAFKPHPRFHYRADSPMRAALPVLRELRGLTQHVDASIVSRLAGAGMLLVPKEITFAAPGVDPQAQPQAFVDLLIAAASAAIKDRDSAAAFVPVVVQVPGELIEKVKHLTFSTPLDEHAMELRGEAVRRFAASIDLPAEVVQGLGDSNHWTAWQIEESAVKLHIEPMMEAVCQAVTIGYLHPALLAAGFSPAEVAEVIVWFDSSELTVRPDRSADAKDLHARDVIGDEALLRETGFGVLDRPTPAELARKILLRLVDRAPELAPTLLPLLGLDVEFPPPAEIAEEALPIVRRPTAPVPAPVDDSDGERGLPSTRDDEPPPPDDEAALLAACDGLVFRALERAGARLVNVLRAEGVTAATGAAPEALHAGLDDDTRAGLPLDDLLDGAWRRVPEVADRHGVEPVALAATLDAYTRTLVTTGWPHSYDRLAATLGCPTDEAAA